jgi:hypothetical protein
MTMRDRLVLIGVVVLAVLGAGWVLVVSPERKEANKLATQVNEAQSQLQSAEGQLNNARQAQAQYSTAYAAIVNLGKAVPTSQQVPSLIYELAQVSGGKNVNFASIVAGSGNGGPSAGAAPSSAGSAPSSATGATAAASFSQLPFTFVFEGGFGDLERLFNQLDGFAKRTASGAVAVNGRLLTIQSVKLGPATTTVAGAATLKGPPKLSGTVTATAYVLPATQSLTGGATAAAPAGTAPTPSASGSSSPAAPAIARVTP